MTVYISGLVMGTIIGFIGGVVTVLSLSFYYAKKEIKKNRSKAESFYKELDKIKETVKKATDVQARVNRVKEISKEQLDMQMQMELPQKNGLDGRYKNGLAKKIKSLEEEKMDILKSILNDGFDPEITTLNSESKTETMKLSEFMGKNPHNAAEKTTKKSKAKLRLVKQEEKEDK